MEKDANQAVSYFDVKYIQSPQYSPIIEKYSGLPATYKFPENSLDIAGNSYITGDPLTQIMGEKRELLGSKIEMILSGIEERRDIKSQIMYRIDLDSCDVSNMIFQLPPYRKHNFDKERLTLEKMKQDLEKQKRMEEVNYFRDLSFLQKDLVETVIQYVSEQNKQNILSGLEE